MSGGAIALPSAFTLRTSVRGAAGPVGIRLHARSHRVHEPRHGIYTIRVVPLIDSAVCR
jgi:hypothetical protein